MSLWFTPEEKASITFVLYMPFGNGSRTCIGMRFALLEARMALIEIVDKFGIVLSPEVKMKPILHEFKVTFF